MKLRELRDEQDGTDYRQRTSRLQKWRELAREAAIKQDEVLSSLEVKPHIELLG